MSYHPENSNTITIRTDINRRQVINTDLSLTESLGEFDTDSCDSFDERTTVRENSRRDDVDPFPQPEDTLEERLRPRFPSRVSILSNTLQEEGEGGKMEFYDLTEDDDQEGIDNKQSGQSTLVPPFKKPAVYDKLTGTRVGDLATIGSSSRVYTGSLDSPRSRPQYRACSEVGSSQRLATGGSAEQGGQKESSGVSDELYGGDGPPIKEERNAGSRDDGTKRPNFDDLEADSNINDSTYRNFLPRNEASKRTAELVFGPVDSTRLQIRADRRGNGEGSKKKRELSYEDELATRSSQPSTKVVPQRDSRNATSGFDELTRDVSSALLTPSRIKGGGSSGTDDFKTRRLTTEHEYITKYLKSIERVQEVSALKDQTLNNPMRNSVLNQLTRGVSAMPLCVLEPTLSDIVKISSADVAACKAANEFKRWERLKNCRLTASKVNANMASLKDTVISVITKSKVVEPILEIIYEVGRVAELDIQHQGVLSQLESPNKYPSELKWIPKDKVNEIADWYIQYDAILDEIVYFNAGVMEMVSPMASFLRRYVGPFPYDPDEEEFDNFASSSKAYRIGSTNPSGSPFQEQSRGLRPTYDSIAAKHEASESNKKNDLRGRIFNSTSGKKGSETPSESSRLAYQLSLMGEDETMSVTSSYQERHPDFKWTDAKLYADSDKGPIRRLDLPSGKFKALVSECSITNSKFAQGWGNEQKMMLSFDRLVAKIKPHRVDGTINVGHWLRLLSTETENFSLPVFMRLQFLREQGGLCLGINDKVRERIQTAFSMPEAFLVGYDGSKFDATHEKTDDKYWLCIWVEVLAWLFKQFFVEINSSLMMKEATRMMKAGIHFTDQDNSYQALFTVLQQLNLVFESMKQSANGLSNSPQMIYSQLIIVLQEKGHTGLLIAKAMEREVNSTLNNPEFTLRNTAHGLTKEEMDDIKANGSTSLTVRHFNIIMQSLLERAQRGEVVYTIDNVSELQRLSQKPATSRKLKPKQSVSEESEESAGESVEEIEEYEEEEETTVQVPKKKTKAKPKATTLSTHTSQTSLNQMTAQMTKSLSIATDLPPPPPREPWFVQGVTQRCKVCNGLHREGPNSDSKNCLFYTANGGPGGTPLVKAKNMLNHDYVVYKLSRKWSLSYKFLEDLKTNILPHIGVTEPKEIEIFVSLLHHGVKRMSDQDNRTTKSLNIGFDWNEEGTATTSQQLPSRVTVNPTKSSLKSANTKAPSKRYQQNEYEGEEDTTEDM